MKAAPVPSLAPELPLAEASGRIIAIRSAELFGFAPAALDESNSRTLHDMRIAAKRLRYVLELVGFTIGSLGEEAKTQARDLQTLIGEIHDHDVLIARLESLPASASRRGLRRLGLRLHSRRDALFADFLTFMARIEESGLRERLAAATTFSPNGAVQADN